MAPRRCALDQLVLNLLAIPLAVVVLNELGDSPSETPLGFHTL